MEITEGTLTKNSVVATILCTAQQRSLIVTTLQYMRYRISIWYAM